MLPFRCTLEEPTLESGGRKPQQTELDEETCRNPPRKLVAKPQETTKQRNVILSVNQQQHQTTIEEVRTHPQVLFPRPFVKLQRLRFVLNYTLL